MKARDNAVVTPQHQANDPVGAVERVSRWQRVARTPNFSEPIPGVDSSRPNNDGVQEAVHNLKGHSIIFVSLVEQKRVQLFNLVFG